MCVCYNSRLRSGRMGCVCHSDGGPTCHSSRILHIHAGNQHPSIHLSTMFISSLCQIQSGRFKTGMCPHFGKPEGCPKGENCTYAHSEEERDRFRNMVKPAKISKPRSGEQFSRGASLGRATVSGLGGRNVGYPGDHTQVKPHDGTPHSSLSSLELIQSAPNSLHDQQAYSDLIRYQQHSGKPTHLYNICHGMANM